MIFLIRVLTQGWTTTETILQPESFTMIFNLFTESLDSLDLHQVDLS